MAKGVPLRELRWEWTLADIQQANAVLDMDQAYDMGLAELPPEE